MTKDIVEEIKENIEEVAENVEDLVEESGGDPKDLVKAAEAESVEGSDIEKKKKELLEKAAKLKAKLGEEAPDTESLKEQVKGKKRTEMLIPLEEYVKSGIYLGTRVVTPDMKPFVYRRRADGLAIFNTDLIDERLKEAIEYLSKFNAEDVILVCKRQAGWKAARMFSELTGIRVFTKKYPAGILTNTQLEDFFENELTIVVDAWLDKNALKDTLDVHKKVLMVCDTNNFSKGADQIVIGNNKSGKSLGVIFYLLARGYCRAKGIEKDIPDLDWWVGEFEDEHKGAKFGV
jgi:small subunit ribosomal protein S2